MVRCQSGGGSGSHSGPDPSLWSNRICFLSRIFPISNTAHDALFRVEPIANPYFLRHKLRQLHQTQCPPAFPGCDMLLTS